MCEENMRVYIQLSKIEFDRDIHKYVYIYVYTTREHLYAYRPACSQLEADLRQLEADLRSVSR